MNDQTSITQSWKDKIYDVELTKKLFSIIEMQNLAFISPVLETLKAYYSQVEGLYTILVYGSFYLKKSEYIKTKLKEIQTMLYGDQNDARVLELLKTYKVFIRRDRYGKATVFNAQNIINELQDIVFILKQWAYKLGFLVPPKRDRLIGMEAIQDVAEM